MLKQVLINVEATDMRVAMLENGELVELFVEQFDEQSSLRNIYKGKVEGIVPGLKAVFVDIGHERNAFLHFSDILNEYDLPTRGRPERLPRTKSGQTKAMTEKEELEATEEDEYSPPPITPEEEDEEDGAKTVRRKRGSLPLHVGDSLLVQVVKEPINRKGPRVTSYLSLPGRYLVMMPYAERQGGVSRKIEDPEQRRRLRDLLHSLKPKTGSLIIRTAGLDVDEQVIREDGEALEKQWKSIKRKNLRAGVPSLILNEQEIIQRLVRDTLRNDINEILIDSKAEMKKLIKACQATAPTMVDRIHLFESSKNLFDVFDVEQQFQKALRRKVWHKSGGFLVIDETEALTAIDVNSGKYVGREDQDQVILKTNLEACCVISRQLRLRDIGGLIVIDFIDMTNRDHQKQVLQELTSWLNRDNAKYALTGFSEFGLVAMTRKRVRMSLSHAFYRQCPYCEGAGRILKEGQIWKKIKYPLLEELDKLKAADSIEIMVHSQLKTYLETELLSELEEIADQYKVKLRIAVGADYHHEQFSIITQAKSVVRDRGVGVPRRRRSPPQKRLESPQARNDNAAKR